MPKKIKKVTKIWTTRDGKRVRICDMEAAHLYNTIKFLERAADAKNDADLRSAYLALGFLNGEHAIESVESAISEMENNPETAGDLWPVYHDLVREATRRGIDLQATCPSRDAAADFTRISEAMMARVIDPPLVMVAPVNTNPGAINAVKMVKRKRRKTTKRRTK